MKWLARFSLITGAVALVVMAVDYAAFWGWFGGWVNYDTQVQWEQVQSGAYTQWHPFAHTFLMMTVPSWIWNNYRVTVLWQGAWFALAFGSLAWALKEVGVRTKWIAIALAVTLLHPQTLFFLMTPLKDSAFALAVLAATAALIVVAGRGAAALREVRVWIPLTLALALASLFRHNGIFFSIPALGLLTLLFVRKAPGSVVRVVLLFAIVFALFRSVLPAAYRVRPASAHPEKYKFIESCGLPLSMMGAVYMKHPDDVPPSARALLESIAPREVWLGPNNWSFSAVKHHGVSVLPEERIAGYRFTGWGDFARDFAATVEVDPGVAIREGLRVTGQVWNPAGHPLDQFRWPLCKVLGWDLAHRLMPIVAALAIPLVGVVGLAVWVCLALSCWGVIRRRWALLLLVLPVLGYDLGSMFFLSGFAVYRFFFCNVLILLPILLAACCARGERNDKIQGL